MAKFDECWKMVTLTATAKLPILLKCKKLFLTGLNLHAIYVTDNLWTINCEKNEIFNDISKWMLALFGEEER